MIPTGALACFPREPALSNGWAENSPRLRVLRSRIATRNIENGRDSEAP